MARSKAGEGPNPAGERSNPAGEGSGGPAQPDHPLLAGLNPEQRKAVTHINGPLLILAGAGSGKTRVLTHRVAWLVQEEHVRPDEVVAITFTNKAAGEMKERIEGLVGPVARTMWISTFHSMCARLLRREAQRIGYKSTFTIHDEDDRRRLVKRCMEELERRPKRYPAGSSAARSATPRTSCWGPPSSASRAGATPRWPPTSTSSTRSGRPAMNAMDFDDLLMKTVELLEGYPDRLQHYQRASASCSSTSTRTPTTRSTASPTCSPGRTQPRRGGRRRPEHLLLAGADIRNILEFSATTPTKFEGLILGLMAIASLSNDWQLPGKIEIDCCNFWIIPIYLFTTMSPKLQLANQSSNERLATEQDLS